MNKKTILEMADDMIFATVKLSRKQRIDIARVLTNLGYRMVNENSVIIPEKLTDEISVEELTKIAKYNDRVRKPACREIANKIYTFVNHYLKYDEEDVKTALSNYIKGLFGDI